MAKRAHGEGTILKRKDGRWQGEVSLGYDQSGKRKRKTVYGKTQKEVRAKLDEIKQQITAGTFSDTKLTVKQYLKQWLEHVSPNLKPRTIGDYRYTVAHYINPALGSKQLAKLKPLDIQSLVNDIAKRSGARTANLCRTRLFTAMKQAVRWELIPRNPVEAVTTVKETKRKQIIWTSEEAVRFLAAARPHRLYALFYLAMATGLRHTELLNLRWGDVEGMTLTVRESKTEKGLRTVTLSPDIIETLDEHRTRQEAEKRFLGDVWHDDTLVFPSEVGTKLNRHNVNRLRTRLIEDARAAWRAEAEGRGDDDTVTLLDEGKLMRRATLHDLRHLNVSIRRKMGQDAKLIADQIGHTDPSFTTRLYTHLFDEDRQAAGVNLKDALGSSTPPTEQN